MLKPEYARCASCCQRQQPHLLRCQLEEEQTNARNVTAGPAEAGNEPGTNRVVDDRDDRNRSSCALAAKPDGSAPVATTMARNYLSQSGECATRLSVDDFEIAQAANPLRSGDQSNARHAPYPSLYSERKPPIRTRGESRMIGMKHSPRTDLAAL